MIEMAEIENEKIRKWLDYHTNMGGLPVTLTLPLNMLESISQYMKDKPFKSASEAIMFLLDTHTEMATNMSDQNRKTGKSDLPFNLEEMDHS
jgi:Arc/MetJ-type ribon-helix-helix transcriptional regulator